MISLLVSVVALLLFVFFLFKVFQIVLSRQALKRRRQEFMAVREQVHAEEVGQSEQSGGLLTAEIVRQCEDLGRRVDRHTNRKDNSRQVSQLVFRIAEHLGVAKETASIYFCEALVYDVGFLDLPEELFYKEILPAKERRLLKTHIQRADSYLGFIPRAFYADFVNVVMGHHENDNGSGYPEGLRGDEIPLAARIIHVVESYVALTSTRSYHKILDKQGAITELRRRPGVYDERIITALEAVM